MQVSIQEVKTTEIKLSQPDIMRAIAELIKKEKRLQVSPSTVKVYVSDDGSEILATTTVIAIKKPGKSKPTSTPAPQVEEPEEELEEDEN